jgi:DNA-binding transcriptional ArsR family regulator
MIKESAAVSVLSALAHQTRLRIFRMLVGAGPQGLAAGALSSRLRISPANLSFHLSHLTHAALIAAHRQGQSIIYTANFDAMSRLIAYLTDNCCGGHPELCLPIGSLKAGSLRGSSSYAEREAGTRRR